MSAYLLLSIRIPDVDLASCDPDQLADDLVAIINKERRTKGLPLAAVGLFPACEWLTGETFQRLKEAVKLIGPETVSGVLSQNTETQK